MHDIGTLPDGRPFFVMRLIRGRTLQEVLGEGSDPVAQRGRLLAVFEQVCQAVAYAHYRQVAHLNLKAAHIMIGAFGEVQVLGWGSARVFGVPPSQQADAVASDCRSDVFALGRILCTIPTGRTPLTVSNEPEAMCLTAEEDTRRSDELLDRCGASGELVALARRCVSPDPVNRPPNGREVAELLSSYRAATEKRLWEAEQRKRRRVQFVLVVAVVLLLAACIVLAVP